MPPSRHPYYGYVRLTGKACKSGVNSLGEDTLEPRKRAMVQSTLCVLCLILAGFMAGFVAHSYTVPQTRDIPIEFMYHEIYSQPPSTETNQAWLALFPRAHGFVQPPGIANLSVLSVFHQLHCVNVLRHGYYVALNASYEKLSLLDLSISRESIKQEHVVHCIDYLRQTLQCFSDQTVEPVDFARGGAIGWGVEHRCSDYAQTVAQADSWELHQDRNPTSEAQNGAGRANG